VHLVDLVLHLDRVFQECLVLLVYQIHLVYLPILVCLPLEYLQVLMGLGDLLGHEDHRILKEELGCN